MKNSEILRKKITSTAWKLFFLATLLSLLTMVQPLYMMNLYDRVLSSQSIPTLISITAIALFIFACFGSFEWIKTQVQRNLGNELEGILKPAIMESSIARIARGDLSARRALVNYEEMKAFLTGPTFSSIFDLVFVPIYLIVLLLFHKTIFLVVLSIGILIALGNILAENSIKKKIERYTEAKYGLKERESELLKTAPELAPLGAIKRLTQSYKQKQESVEGDMTTALELQATIDSVNKSTMMMTQILILAVAAYFVLTKEVSTSILFVVNLVASRAIQPLIKANVVLRGYFKSKKAIISLLDFLKFTDEQKNEEIPLQPAVVRVRALTYVEPNQKKKILSNISIDLDPGEILAVMGPSGSGKSTLLKILSGNIRNYFGSVQLNNRELKQWEFDENFTAVGYAAQFPSFFTGTIYENISDVGRTITQEEVFSLLEKFDIKKDLMSLADGIQTTISPDGSPLSGGVTKILSIVRSLNVETRLLILDEPTSGLDGYREKIFWRAIRTLANEGYSCVIATHSLNNLGNADKTLIIKKGEIFQYGKTSEVLNKISSMSERSNES